MTILDPCIEARGAVASSLKRAFTASTMGKVDSRSSSGGEKLAQAADFARELIQLPEAAQYLGAMSKSWLESTYEE